MEINGIEITVIRKRIKNMHLRVKTDGSVVVSAPLYLSQKDVESFVSSHEDWIRSHLDSIKPAFSPDYTSGETIKIAGEDHKLQIRQGKGEALLSGDDLIIYVKDPSLKENREKAVKKFLRNDLLSRIDKLYAEVCEKTNLSPSEISIRDMKTRWGSCNTQTHKIWICLSLAHFNDKFLSYVMYHEFTHLLYRGHGADFKAFLSRVCPDWREIRKTYR